ncbi:uncharacterized protein LOC124909820 [Impatiens glandulifera]|uniref:uncharacterized protein LOC124909820 n=1 Tax=Impatiens glandulifera TaxID=253017 RepID=UPI001FB0CE7F|nr:uncharacterized protein LOC124909820 [Impatiens glandulifera]
MVNSRCHCPLVDLCNNLIGSPSHNLRTRLYSRASLDTATWDFQDNCHSCAVSLKQEFSTTIMKDFLGVSTYCQHLKVPTGHLQDVSSLVLNDRLILQLVAGLAEAYNGVATLLRHSDPLPQFYQA